MTTKYTNVMQYARVLLCENRDYRDEIIANTNFIYNLANRTFGKQSGVGELLVIAYCYYHSTYADDGLFEDDLNFDRIEEYEQNIEQSLKSIDPKAFIQVQDIALKMHGLSSLLWKLRYKTLYYNCRNDVRLMIVVANAVREQLQYAKSQYEHKPIRYWKRHCEYSKRVYRKLINRICALAKQEQ